MNPANPMEPQPTNAKPDTTAWWRHGTLVSLPDLTASLPESNGKRLTLAAVADWCRTGIGGHVLPSVRLGRGRFTTRECFDKWVQAVTAASKSTTTTTTKSNPTENKS